MFANNHPGHGEIELNVSDLEDLSIRRGPNSIFLTNVFNLNVLDRVLFSTN